MMGRFHDRHDAGRRLARKLMDYAGRDDVSVLALPRGGVPVGYEIARALRAPLDVFVVRKLGVPGHPELAFGAIASGGIRVLNSDMVRAFGIAPALVEHVAGVERVELERRERAYRDGWSGPGIAGRTVILVDDGLATGATMLAAVAALRQRSAAAIVVAVPVASREACATFRSEVDDCVCATTPMPFHGVGAWYDDFSQTTDGEVRQCLAAARGAAPASSGGQR